MKTYLKILSYSRSLFLFYSEDHCIVNITWSRYILFSQDFDKLWIQSTFFILPFYSLYFPFLYFFPERCHVHFSNRRVYNVKITFSDKVWKCLGISKSRIQFLIIHPALFPSILCYRRVFFFSLEIVKFH